MADWTLARSLADSFLASPPAVSAAKQSLPATRQSQANPLDRRSNLTAIEPANSTQNLGTLPPKSTGDDAAGDKEFFLNQFDSFTPLTRYPDTVRQSYPITSPQSGPFSSTALVVRIPITRRSGQKWTNVKRVVPSVTISSEPEMRSLRSRWSRGDFMRGSSSASQQASLEWAVQLWTSKKFAAGRVHSMIRCSDQKDVQVVDVTEDVVDVQKTARRLTKRTTPKGYPCCSHPGCTKQIQAKGKCMAHGGVRQCSYPDCTSRVGSGRHGLCFEHGGRPICSVEECKKTVRKGGKCEEHSGGHKICSVPECTKGAQKRGLCVRHGGFSVCTFEDCDERALTKGLCRHHGGGSKCQSEGCEKLSQKHGYCHRHAVENGMKAQRKGRCKGEGCLKFRICQGYCSKHAQEHGFSVGRRCKFEGCEKSAQAGGYCVSHGGGYHCKHPGCTKQASSKGLCCTHGGRITCKAPGCEKWGLTHGEIKGYCIKHGGGRRCKHPGCNKSVQIRGFCSVHSWFRCQAGGCEKRIKTEGYCEKHSAKKSSGSDEESSSEEST